MLRRKQTLLAFLILSVFASSLWFDRVCAEDDDSSEEDSSSEEVKDAQYRYGLEEVEGN
jgi:hypothetical protein